MKVIASSLRKGNIVDIDGKLAVIVTTENIHPGKGTPVTQMDVRRIADGVKLALRFKTTDQVERAFVEDRKHQFMYQDSDGFHFMNMESYDQVPSHRTSSATRPPICSRRWKSPSACMKALRSQSRLRQGHP